MKPIKDWTMDDFKKALREMPEMQDISESWAEKEQKRKERVEAMTYLQALLTEKGELLPRLKAVAEQKRRDYETAQTTARLKLTDTGNAESDYSSNLFRISNGIDGCRNFLKNSAPAELRQRVIDLWRKWELTRNSEIIHSWRDTPLTRGDVKRENFTNSGDILAEMGAIRRQIAEIEESMLVEESEVR